MIRLLMTLLLLICSESLLVEGHADMPWSQASIHFNQILNSVKEDERDIWEFEMKIIEDIKTEIHHWCREGKIRIYHSPIDTPQENCLRITTKNYVVTHPQSREEEKLVWTLPAVRCKKQEAQQPVRPVQSKGSGEISARKKDVVVSINPVAREELYEITDQSESDSSSSSEEHDEHLEEKRREEQKISNLDKLLLNNRQQPFDVDDEPLMTEEDLEKYIETLRRQERERFVELEVLVVNIKSSSNPNPTEVIKKEEPKTKGHIDSIFKWKRGERHGENKRSEHYNDEHVIEEMDPDKIRKMKSSKKEHDQTLAISRIKDIKEKRAMRRNHLDQNARESTIETMKSDLDHSSKIKDDRIREDSLSEQSSSSEYTNYQHPLHSDDQKKDLLSAKSSRKKIKTPSTI